MLPVEACPRMSVGYAEGTSAYRTTLLGRTSTGAGMGEITFNLRLGAEKLLVNTSPIPAPQKTAPYQETGLTSDTNSSITL